MTTDRDAKPLGCADVRDLFPLSGLASKVPGRLRPISRLAPSVEMPRSSWSIFRDSVLNPLRRFSGVCWIDFSRWVVRPVAPGIRSCGGFRPPLSRDWHWDRNARRFYSDG